MTLATETARTRYSGNGSTYQFSTVFPFQANSHVRVILTDAEGVDTEWTENDQYTLTGADTGSAGQVSVFYQLPKPDNRPQSGEYLTIIRNVPFTQTLDADALAALPATAIESALDKVWMALTQIKEKLSRAVVGSETGAGGTPSAETWSPVFAVASDGLRRVLQIADWVGGVGTKPDTGDYVGVAGLVASIGDGVDVRGPQGLSGAGSGDMLASQNLNDVSDKATAFANIKQAATTSANGVVELATDAEAQAKASTSLVLTASNLAALAASLVFAGLVELATEAETVTGTDETRAATPKGVKAAIDASSAFAGGTAMLFVQTSAPTGWTKSATHNDKALRVVSGTVGSGGSVDFSTVFGRTATDNHTLITAEMPAHAHTYATPGGPNNGGASCGSSGDTSNSGTTSTVGGGGGHSHNIDLRVKYVDVIIATKD